jgi:hypothetical protein
MMNVRCTKLFVEALMPKKTVLRQVEFPLNRAFTFVKSGPVLLFREFGGKRGRTHMIKMIGKR